MHGIVGGDMMSKTQSCILRGRPDLEAILEYLSINGPSSARAMKAAGVDAELTQLRELSERGLICKAGRVSKSGGTAIWAKC